MVNHLEDDTAADSYWWQRLKEDDSAALAYLYNRYADWLLRYGLSVTYERAIVKDAVQELFLQLWNSRHNLSNPGSVKFYLMASIRRLILKTIRAERIFCDPIVEVEDGNTADSLEEIHQTVQKAVRALPPRQQELIFLKYYQKMSYEEITELTGLDYQILRNTVYRAVKALRVALINHSDIFISFLLSIFL